METAYSKRLEKRFGIYDGLVALVCLVGAGVSGYFFYLERKFTSGVNQGSAIGTLERRDGKVRRKSASSFVWQGIEEQEKIYQKDALQTGPESTSLIRLSDGTSMELSENSLVVMKTLENISLNFVKGTAIVRESGGGVKQIQVNSDGKLNEEKLSVQLLEPPMFSEFFVKEQETKNIFFTWGHRGPLKEGLLQVSSNRHFPKSKTTSIKLAEAKNELTQNLGPGQYFWRIITLGGTKSPIQQFRISEVGVLKPVGPTAGELIRVFGEEAALPFRWILPTRLNQRASLEVGQHQLELSTDPRFTSSQSAPVITQNVSAVSGATLFKKNFSVGKWYWRLQSRYQNLTLTSATESFQLEHISKLTLDLVGPVENESIPLKANLRFYWNCSASEMDYVWELKDSQEKIISQYQGRASAALWKMPQVGQYQWRVSAQWKGNVLGESPWRKLNVLSGDTLVLLSPSKEQKILFWKAQSPIHFRWKKDVLVDDPAFSYLFELAADSDFKNILFSEKSKTSDLLMKQLSSELTLSKLYFWRVKILAPTNQIVKISAIQSFSYGQFPLAQAPSELSPGMSKVFNLRDDPNPPKLRWADVPGAKAYEISIRQRPPQGESRSFASTAKMFKKVIESAEFSLDHMVEGHYLWSVRAIDEMGRLGEASPELHFEYSYGAPLTAPKLISPEVQ